MKATVKESGPLLDFLLEMMQTTKKKSGRQMLKYSHVKVDGATVKLANYPLKPGQVVAIDRENRPPRKLPGTPKGSVRILYEDEAIIVVDKPSGVLSMETDREKDQTMQALLSEYVRTQGGHRVFVVHRLDRNVAGVMVFAKTVEAQTDIQLNWEHASKKYLALVEGVPKEPSGRIETWLEEISVAKVIVTHQSPRAKYSITDYTTRKSKDGVTLLDIKLRTGRRHQIRVHLAHIGCPIIGDRVYGTATPRSKDILLFAYLLSFRHPQTGRMVTFKATLPNWAK